MPKLTPYDEVTEEYMTLFFETLDEKSRRYYAAVEAQKLGHGGVAYISRPLAISERTVEMKIFVDTIDQVFEKGVSVFDDYLDNCNIKFDA